MFQGSEKIIKAYHIRWTKISHSYSWYWQLDKILDTAKV